MIRNLRIKFICITMGIVALMLISIMGLIILFTYKQQEAESLNMLKTIAANPVINKGPNVPPPAYRHPHLVVHYKNSQSLIQVSGNLIDYSDTKALGELMSAVEDSEKSVGILEKQQLRFFKQSHPFGEVIAFADITGERDTLHLLIRNCTLIGIASFLIFFLLCNLLAYWLTKPVADAFAKQKQFISDASHELKTPLTVIMTNAELLQNMDNNADEKVFFAQNILATTKKMKHLVSELLSLTAIEKGTIRTHMSTIPFGSIVQKASFPFEPLYYENNRTLITDIETDIMLTGNEDYLQQVLSILLDNALKYSVEGSEVALTLNKNNRHCLLCVKSIGPTLSKQECCAIFERFYQKDSAHHDSDSYGLGLSIAKSIVKEHKGKIWCESTRGCNSFFVKLPIRP